MLDWDSKKCPACSNTVIDISTTDVELDEDVVFKSTVKCPACGLQLSRIGFTKEEAESKASQDWNRVDVVTCEMIRLPYHTQPAWRCSVCNKTVLDIGDFCQYCKSKVVRVGEHESNKSLQ